jgi:sugar lactone lactonase YvrE
MVEPVSLDELPPGGITTIAGGSTFTGDGGPATEAPIALPQQIAIDAVGNIYFTDTEHHRIRKVDHATGVILTVAGNGDAGFSGDGDLALAASLSSPSGIALDVSGNIFIADTGNSRIRRVDAATGRITTFAGRGPAGPSAQGQPINIDLNAPLGLAFDPAGNLYIADTTNHRILKITRENGVITFAGNGQSAFSGDNGPATAAALNAPRVVATDSDGNVWIVDTGNNRIRQVDKAGIIRTIHAGTLNGPRGLAVSVNREVFISDSGNHRILRVSSVGDVSTIAGTGSAGFDGDRSRPESASLNDPYGIAVDGSGMLLVADRRNNRIRKIAEGQGRLLTPFGVIPGPPIITTIAGNGQLDDIGDGGPATAAVLSGPSAALSDGAGNLYVSDSGHNRVRRVDAVTGTITTIAGSGTGGLDGDGGPATEASLRFPQGLAIHPDGSLYIADTQNHVVRKVQPNGFISTFAGTGTRGYSGDNLAANVSALSQPFGLAIDAQGNVYISDTGNHRIRKVAAGTQLMTTIAGNGSAGFSNEGGVATTASLSVPRGIALDAAGNLYIADSGNNRIRRVDAGTQVIHTVAGNGQQSFSGDEGPATAAALNSPLSVTIDGTGAVLILDSFNQRLRQVAMQTGVILTIAGSGFPGFFGDNGPAIEAQFWSPSDVSINQAGNILIADRTNNRIRGIRVSSR